MSQTPTGKGTTSVVPRVPLQGGGFSQLRFGCIRARLQTCRIYPVDEDASFSEARLFDPRRS
jgi:hypothetical protein